MKITVPLEKLLALTVFRHQHGAPSHSLGDSFHAAHRLILRRIAAGDYPREISATRGQRIAGTIVPSNMRENMLACEARAWNHSDLAGALWEHGFRASRACKLAKKYCCTDSESVLSSPCCQSATSAPAAPGTSNLTEK